MAGQFHTTCFVYKSLTDMCYRILGCTFKLIQKIVPGHLVIKLNHHFYILRHYFFLESTMLFLVVLLLMLLIVIAANATAAVASALSPSLPSDTKPKRRT